jgi:hypothetical protein
MSLISSITGGEEIPVNVKVEMDILNIVLLALALGVCMGIGTYLGAKMAK